MHGLKIKKYSIISKIKRISTKVQNKNLCQICILYIIFIFIVNSIKYWLRLLKITSWNDSWSTSKSPFNRQYIHCIILCPVSSIVYFKWLLFPRTRDHPKLSFTAMHAYTFSQQYMATRCHIGRLHETERSLSVFGLDNMAMCRIYLYLYTKSSHNILTFIIFLLEM